MTRLLPIAAAPAVDAPAPRTASALFVPAERATVAAVPAAVLEVITRWPAPFTLAVAPSAFPTMAPVSLPLFKSAATCAAVSAAPALSVFWTAALPSTAILNWSLVPLMVGAIAFGYLGYWLQGALSPTLGKVVGLAYLPPGMSPPGSRFAIRIEKGRMIEAEVVPTPFYDPENKRQEI